MRNLALIFSPWMLLGGLIFLRLCLINSELVADPLVVAPVCLASIFICYRIFNDFKVLQEPCDTALGLIFQAPLLFASRDFMVLGSEVTSWIWIAHVGVLLIMSVILLFRGFQHEIHNSNETSMGGGFWFISIMWIWCFYGLTGLARTAYTEHRGRPEPGHWLERNRYQTTVKVVVRRDLESYRGEYLQGEASVEIINREIFWDRSPEIIFKSFSIGRGNRIKIRWQEEQLFPKEDMNEARVETVHGNGFWISLAEDELQKFRRWH
ncbi:MAG: hypothetical protein HS117_18100 [Verrucomicrobiaceae bacterium]|nr:hypothetical protein [Verrucomicrobiaceae bacterium]